MKNSKKYLLDRVSDLVRELERRRRETWIRKEMISKMDESRKWQGLYRSKIAG
jgi:hypothetical protein